MVSKVFIDDSGIHFRVLSPSVGVMQQPEANGYVTKRVYDGAFWSLTSEKQWFCEDYGYAPNLFSAQTAGMVISTVILMQLSDK